MQARFIASLLLAAASGVSLYACEREVSESPSESLGLPTVENIEENPDRFLGTRVTLTGEVDKVYSQRAFELENLDWVFDDEVLVLTRTPVKLGAQKLEDDKQVSLSGTVHKLTVAEIERDLGWDLDNEIEIAWQNRPVVVADYVEAIRSYARWSEKAQPTGEIVSLWALYAVPAPLQLENARVDLQSVEVAEKTESGLWVGFDGSADLFVVPTGSAELPAVEAGSQVDVKGTLKRLPPVAEAPADWKLSDADKQRMQGDALYLEASSLSTADERAAQRPPAEAAEEG